MPMTISIDDQLKKEFAEVCKEIGLSPSAAIGVFARAVVRERCIPFTLSAVTSSERETGVQEGMQAAQSTQKTAVSTPPATQAPQPPQAQQAPQVAQAAQSAQEPQVSTQEAQDAQRPPEAPEPAVSEQAPARDQTREDSRAQVAGRVMEEFTRLYGDALDRS